MGFSYKNFIRGVVSVASITCLVLFVLTAHYNAVPALVIPQKKLSLVNITPYQIEFVVAYPYATNRWKTIGWYSVNPGDVWTNSFSSDVESDAEFYIFAKTIDDELVQWAHAGELSRDELPVMLWCGNDIERAITDEAMDFKTDRMGSSPKPAGSYQAPFAKISATTKRDGAIFYCTPTIGYPQLHPDFGSQADIVAACIEAKTVRASLIRQMKLDKTWSDKPYFPFALGLRYDPKDDFRQLGVVVSPTSATLPGGEPMPFKDGDEIVYFSSCRVYGVRDIASLLYDHARNVKDGGIDKPIHFAVNRNGKLVSGVTSYWFVKEYFESQGNAPTEVGSLLWGAWDGITLGASAATTAGAAKGLEMLGNGLEFISSKLSGKKPEYKTGPSFEEMRWALNQQKGMRHQWYGGAYFLGQLGSVFVCLPRYAVEALGGRSLSRFASSTAGKVAFEVAENVVWTIADSTSVTTSEDLRKQLMFVVPFSVGAVIVTPCIFKKVNWR